MTDDLYRDWAAAYVLGALEPDERAEYETHLEECRRCRADVVDFAPVPSLLAGLRESDVAPRSVDLVDAAATAAAGNRDRVERSRRRWRMVAAAAAVVALLVGVISTVRSDDDPSPDFAGTDLALVSDVDATGFIRVSDRPWGTFILIDLFGVPQRDGYAMWTVSTDGEWDQVATWAWSEDGTCGVPGATPLHPGEIERIVITGAADARDALVTGLSR